MTVTISSQAKDLLRKISREFDDERRRATATKKYHSGHFGIKIVHKIFVIWGSRSS